MNSRPAQGAVRAGDDPAGGGSFPRATPAGLTVDDALAAPVFVRLGWGDLTYNLIEEVRQLREENDQLADEVIDLKGFALFVADLDRPSRQVVRQRVTLNDLIRRAQTALSPTP